MTGDRIKGIIGIGTLLLVIGSVAFLAQQDMGSILDPKAAMDSVISSSDSPANPSDTAPRQFAVRQGDTAASISERLESSGLIKSALAFRLLAESKGVATELAVGEYELSPGMKPSEIIDILASGRTKSSPLITIPEGWRSEQVAERVAARSVSTVDEFMTVVRSGKDRPSVGGGLPSGAGLEGYLFPDSYGIDSRTTAESLVQRMIAQFDSKTGPAIREKAASRGMTIHQIVTLASIIEREAVIPSERPMMAGVFYNRLREGMKLDTDPTVQYAVASNDAASREKYGWWKTSLTAQDLEIDSPYNTYRNAGLPPGPICNPGLASLNAALDPTSSDYFYFVARPDGSHAFAKTLDEHIDNVAKYQSR